MKTGGTASKGKTTSQLAVSQRDLAEGHIDLEMLIDLADVNKEIDLLAEGTTQVQQMVFWEIVGDDVYYRIVLTPYDRPAHQLMMSPAEALFMSFLSADNQRIVPVSAAFRIPTHKLRVATRDGYAAGWFYDGRIPLEGGDAARIDHAEVGWIFSSKLHARLKGIQAPNNPAGRRGPDPRPVKTG